MPDAIPPVGAMGQVPQTNPLGTYSSILGIQQQQQNLQTGAYNQQAVQAGAQQAQQKNQELQAAQQLVFNGVKSGKYTNPDGTLNRVGLADDITKVAPTYGAQVTTPLLSQANEIVQNTQAKQNLSNSQQQTLANTFQSLAAKPNLSNTDITNGLDTLTDEFANVPGFKRMALSMATHLPQNASTQQLQGIMGQWASSGIGQPTQAPSTINTGSVIQPGATNRYSGAFTPAGGGISIKPGPTETPAYKAQVAFTGNQAAALAGRIAQGNESANQSPQALDALSRARAILDSGTWTGGTFSMMKELKNALAGVGIDTSSATNANELVKNLARYEGTRASGVGNTDAARQLFETGAPNTKVDPQAAKNIVTQSMANEMALQGYAKSVGSAATPQEAAQKEQQFRSTPNLVEGYEYSLMRSPAEAEQFMKRYNLTPQQLSQTRAQMKQQGLL